MGAEDLPIVCKYCREPLRLRRVASGYTYIEQRTGDGHFIGDQCPVVIGADKVLRAIQVAQQERRI